MSDVDSPGFSKLVRQVVKASINFDILLKDPLDRFDVVLIAEQ